MENVTKNPALHPWNGFFQTVSVALLYRGYQILIVIIFNPMVSAATLKPPTPTCTKDKVNDKDDDKEEDDNNNNNNNEEEDKDF